MPPAPLHEQVLHLPGDSDRPVDLVVTLMTPDGAGPFPLAVVNHGSDGKISPAATPRYRLTFAAYYFLSRGYAVALPMMRGFAGSGGSQHGHGCDLAALAMENGRDIEAVIDGLAQDSRIDSSRVVASGQSFGGWNTLGLGALQPRHVRALVDFFGGVQSSGCPESQGGGNALADAAERLGASTLLPGLWFYGENDSLFGPDIWQRMHGAYIAHGARAELVDIGQFEDDSHQMLSHPESLPLWTPRLDAFLAGAGLPSAELFPAYLPMKRPPPSHFAPLDDIAALPWGGDKAKASYRLFLAHPFPRAFVVAPGLVAEAHGGFDPLAWALSACSRALHDCVPYAVDDQVVFVPPAALAGPPATGFAAIGDVAAVPWLTDRSRDAYRGFLTHPPPRAFVIGPGGESVSVVARGDALAHAMAICRGAGIVCRAYAVDNAVVWVPPPPPAPPPRASGFAALSDVGAVPWVTQGSRVLYAHFLAAKLPRAFVIAPGGQAAAAQGGYDPLARALEKCRRAGLACLPYAVDDSVVWVRPPG